MHQEGKQGVTAERCGLSENERDTVRDGEIVRKETETGKVKRIWGSRLKSVPQREGCGSLDSEEGQSVS